MYDPIMNNVPYQWPYTQTPVRPPKAGIIRVTGEAGARALQLGPDDEVLALDTTDNVLWLIQTDSAAFKTVTPFAIAHKTPEPQPDFKSFEERFDRIEQRMKEFEELVK